MKIVDKYYEKLHKQTARMTKKLFGKDIAGCLALRYELKKHLEEVTGKAVDEITNEDIIKNKISCLDNHKGLRSNKEFRSSEW